jgi:hypothetical protein
MRDPEAIGLIERHQPINKRVLDNGAELRIRRRCVLLVWKEGIVLRILLPSIRPQIDPQYSCLSMVPLVM